MRTRIKICGVTTPRDALVAARAGADAVGLVFYPPSSRALDLDQAQEIARQLPAFVTAVALFLDADLDKVKAVIQHVQPNVLQFHGSESAEYCRSFGMPYIKAVAMGGAVDLAGQAKTYSDAKALLLDGHTPGQAGGQGLSFDWSQALPETGPPLILAGGLNPGNVAQAISLTRPYGVDVSSGVESAPGVKDQAKLDDFMQAVYRADHSRKSS